VFFETSTSIFASDFGIWKIILDFTASLLLFSALFNSIPIGPIARLKRDAQFDTLEKYGLSPSYVVAGVSLLVAIGAGCIEVYLCIEIFML
jgi:predicted membrane protein